MIGGSYGIWGLLAFVLAIWVVYDVLANNKKISTGMKLLWIILGFILPIAGPIIYYLVGKKK